MDTEELERRTDRHFVAWATHADDCADCLAQRACIPGEFLLARYALSEDELAEMRRRTRQPVAA